MKPGQSFIEYAGGSSYAVIQACNWNCVEYYYSEL